MGLSVEVPILDDRRGPVVKAQVEAKRASLQRELSLAEVAATLQRQALVIAARQAALERFEADAAARLASLKEMAENAYRLGKGTIFELLDSARSREELLGKRIELVATLLEAQILFLSASGELAAAP
jgi:outer membrane protein TolC